MTADLHIHTTASDGRLSPTAIIEQAVQAGLSYIAITDHDTVDGLLQLSEIRQSVPTALSLIPGIELSTDLPESEVHILGYYIDIYNAELREQLKALVAYRHQRTKQIIAKLEELGYYITYIRVLELAGGATAIGRPHIARALVEKNYFPTITEVFNTLLHQNGPAYVPHYQQTPQQVIELIKKAGGISILAHPGLINNDNIIFDIIKLGISGLEVYHPKHTEEQTQKFLTIANHNQLAITGGSDFHANPARFPDKLGIFTIPAILVDKLKNYIHI